MTRKQRFRRVLHRTERALAAIEDEVGWETRHRLEVQIATYLPTTLDRIVDDLHRLRGWTAAELAKIEASR
jgi:hypothetical protein